MTSILFHQKQLQLVTGDADGHISIWDLVDKRRVALLQVPSEPTPTIFLFYLPPSCNDLSHNAIQRVTAYCQWHAPPCSLTFSQ